MSLDELEALLLVQERDIALDQLRHRRDAMPERAELIARTNELRQREVERSAVGERHRVVHAEERRIDDEAQVVGERADEVNKKLYSGSVSSPRELQAMQADIDMLLRRRSDLEDEELEVMEQREALDTELAALDGTIAALQATVAQLGATISETEVEIDDEIARETALRTDLAKPIAETLLRDYERRRVQNRGAGAARLVGTTCQACHLTIPSTEAEQIRRGAGNVVAYCDNCSAILVP
ncbi:MAG TPA: C4-type zinc ribbon domain-containing protein [Acidimicrobiia bacterium]|nr:C4-type zinc ribbon domain-containing protein [Acidimicrobiia bacterium]